MRQEVGTALGQASLTVEEQATTFATLANNGDYVTPHVIGDHPERHGDQCQGCPAGGADPGRGIRRGLRALLRHQAGRHGSQHRPAGWPQIIAKTGTTNLSQSAFFYRRHPAVLARRGDVHQPARDARSSAGQACIAAANQEARRHQASRPCMASAACRVTGGQWPALDLEDLRDEGVPPDDGAGLPESGTSAARPGNLAAAAAQAGPDPAAMRQRVSSGSTATETETETETRTHHPDSVEPCSPSRRLGAGGHPGLPLPATTAPA